ncbi:MAG TPA: lytic transglycosylase domain-containing protein [Vicinamibacterales bacterium]|nr:lytic transglycosylase domain-containing protein [Vicinamibacterales bacterium]
MYSKVLFSSFVLCLVLGTAVPASAEIVFLASGQTISIKSHRIEGDQIVLTLRGGGEVICDKSLISKIVPDEVPHPEPAEEGAAAPAPQKPAAKADPRLLESTPYGEIIAAMSQAHGVDPMLVRAVIQVESNYRPRARSHKGAMGLMQLMPATAREYNVRNPYDPKANIAAGVKHLKGLLDRFEGAVDLALAAYNAGEGAVKKFGGIPPYRETRNYVSRILSLAGWSQ